MADKLDIAFEVVADSYHNDLVFTEEIIARIEEVLRRNVLATEGTYSQVAEEIAENVFKELKI